MEAATDGGDADGGGGYGVDATAAVDVAKPLPRWSKTTMRRKR